MKTALTVLLITVLVGCSTSRYKHAQDFTPPHRDKVFQLPLIAAIPEPISLRGNADQYQVWGKTYYVDKYIREYQAEGTASWYGKKFHGYETSNGEIYDVYQFTAAHKSLPLPSFVKVTNLENGTSLVVRVNDRGPFHGDRLIDLSYAAAVRLGFDKKGTAPVSIELVAPPIFPKDYQHLQVAALSTKNRAIELKQQLAQLLDEPVYIEPDVQRGLHKVRIGPIAPHRIASVQNILHQQQLYNGIIVEQVPTASTLTP